MPELRPFQEKGVEHLINTCKGRGLVWVPMGRGKTPIAAKVCALLSARRIVIVCKDSGIPVWTRKTTDPEKLLGRDWLEHFTGRKVVVHRLDGLTQAARKIVWAIQTPKDEVHIWVVVYNTFAIDNGVVSKDVRRTKKKKGEQYIPLPKVIPYGSQWDMLICDECKRISNRNSAAAVAVEQFLYQHSVPYFLPMSGTPGDKGPISFWTYWRCINRKLFSSYWAYLDHFYTTMENPFGGQEIVERRKDTAAEWNRLINKYAYFVSDTDSAEGLPPLSREKIYAKMEVDQEKLYNDILEDMVSVQGNDIVVAQNTMVRMLRLRQILICPNILGDSFSMGGAIRTFCDYLDEGSDNDQHCVIFTPFTAAFEPFTLYLKNRGYENVFHLHGGISVQQQYERIESFRKTRGITLCSIKYAEAFSLEPATKAWFIGYEYSPDENDQAERRLYRITTKEPIQCNYITYGTPTDERMTDIIAIKRERIDLSLPENVQKLIRGLL